jgi:hypothetical protein
MNPMKPITGIIYSYQMSEFSLCFYVVFKIKLDNICHMFNAPTMAGIIGHVAGVFL